MKTGVWIVRYKSDTERSLARAIRTVCWFAVSIFALLPGAGQAGQQQSIESLFAAVNGSVVLVRSMEFVPVVRDGIMFSPVGDIGAGVVISKDGDILTAAHLVQVADAIQVEFADGSTAEARVVASDPAGDLSLLKVAKLPESAAIAQLGDSDTAKVGQRVFAIGAPYGLAHTLSVGHVSARIPPGVPGRPFNFAEFLQLDVAIHKGNSGGPLFNLQGHVIGIISHTLSGSGEFRRIGFAVTSRSIRELIFGRRAPWSGVSVFGLDERLARILNLPQPHGLLVQKVARNSPAARLGLVPGFLPATIGDKELLLGGDIILEVDGIPVGTFQSYLRLRDHFAKTKKDQITTVKVLRHGKILALTTGLEE